MRNLFIVLEDKEFKENIRNTRKKLETPMALAMPCKTSKTCKHGETQLEICVYVGSRSIHKSAFGRISTKL